MAGLLLNPYRFAAGGGGGPTYIGPVDEFPTIAAHWTTVGPGITATADQARLEMTTSYTEMTTANSYALEDGEVIVEMVNDATGDNADVYLYVGTNSGNRAQVERLGTTLYFVTGGTDSSITYDATAHKWWRVVETAGDMTFYTAPDGSSWTLRRTVTGHGMDLSAVRVALGAGRSTGTGGPFYAYFDHLNSSP